MTASAPYDARAIANFLLEAVENNGRMLTQLSLYKIVYFCHGWHLSINNGALVKQEFEAWEHGPVVKVLRDEFKMFGDNPITARALKLDIFTGIRAEVSPKLAPHDARFVHSVLDSYGQYHAWKLRDMTHEPGSPWDNLWNPNKPLGRLALRLRNDEIKAHFDSLPQRIWVS